MPDCRRFSFALARLCVLVLMTLYALCIHAPKAHAQSTRAQDYLVYVVSESADKITVVRFGPQGARIEQELDTGSMPANLDGPHGIDVAPDKQFYYVSLAHGQPFGSVWKYRASNNSVVSRVTLGLFPATMDVSPDGNLLFVVNFNLHGDMVPSSVSVVATEPMLEIARIPTCIMPHGSRFNPQGTKHYSVCMMDDTLVEIDLNTLKVSRHLILTKGKEMGMMGAPKPGGMQMPGGIQLPGTGYMGEMSKQPTRDTSGHGLHAPKPGDISCSPTWAQPSADGAYIYVACNKSSELVEIKADTWKVTRRINAGAGIYNLAVTTDGRLIATNKRGPSVSIFDLKTGRELANIPTKRKVVHGAVVSPDDRYAFISVEGIGSEPGTVEVIDLRSLKAVASVDVGQQAGGIDFLRAEPTKR
jgi:DNA-binding beta-propeller fold protein YncE